MKTIIAKKNSINNKLNTEFDVQQKVASIAKLTH